MMVAVGFNPRSEDIPSPVRRVATIEDIQASLRDAMMRTAAPGPWVETHGYHHSVATRRTVIRLFAATMATPGVFVASLPFSHLPNHLDIGPSTYL